MINKDKVNFEIIGKEFEHLKKFWKQHEDCACGSAGDQFEYSFIPTGLGMAVIIKCSCGQKLYLGDFLDHEIDEYDESEYRVLTDEDLKNAEFEKEALHILRLKDPHCFRAIFCTDQSFELIYSVSAYGIAYFADKRIANCILWKYNRGKLGEEIDNYQGMDEAEKIEVFFNYFAEHMRDEISKYDCRNVELLRLLNLE